MPDEFFQVQELLYIRSQPRSPPASPAVVAESRLAPPQPQPPHSSDGNLSPASMRALRSLRYKFLTIPPRRSLRIESGSMPRVLKSAAVSVSSCIHSRNLSGSVRYR